MVRLPSRTICRAQPSPVRSSSTESGMSACILVMVAACTILRGTARTSETPLSVVFCTVSTAQQQSRMSRPSWSTLRKNSHWRSSSLRSFANTPTASAQPSLAPGTKVLAAVAALAGPSPQPFVPRVCEAATSASKSLPAERPSCASTSSTRVRTRDRTSAETPGAASTAAMHFCSSFVAAEPSPCMVLIAPSPREVRRKLWCRVPRCRR